MGRSTGSIEELYRARYVGFREALAPVVGSRERAHDVVQEAFARALTHSHQLRDERSLAAWVWRIAWRLALQERRQRGRDERLPDDLTILDPESDPVLARALLVLPPRRRLVLFLRYYAEFSYAEIAEALDITEGTVAATLSQAHAALLAQLGRKEIAR